MTSARFLWESLQLLLQSCEHEARLNVLGRLAVGHDTLRLLINRLHLEDDRKRFPGIAEQGIVRPLFIVGLPRTGTSLLHGLLAQESQQSYTAELGGHVPLPAA